MYDITALKNDLTGVMHGTQLNQIYNLNGVIDRAARQLLLDCDPQETIREVAFTTPVFDSVFTYALAADVKGISILDIRPQVNRSFTEVFNQDYSQQFDLGKSQNLGAAQFNINFNSSVKTILVNDPYTTPAVITNTASGTTLNGTWATGGHATALTTDNVNYVAGAGSLMFNLSSTGVPGSTGYLENSTMAAVDLTEQLNQGWEFLWSFLPTASAFTSIEFRWGSSASNYYTKTATVTQQNTAFQNGWNLMGYDWSAASTVGSPNVAAITYMRVTWTYDGTLQTAVRLNDITSQLGSILNYLYYSKYLFRDVTTGAYQETVTDNSNLINLDTESYNLLFYKTAYLASQQQQGKNALGYDGKFFSDEYDKALTKYKLRYRSQTQKPRQYYYKKPNPNYGTGAGWWWSR